MQKWTFRILLYLSILFLIIYLVKADFVSLKDVKLNYSWLLVSIILLWLGFLVSALSWKYALKYHNINISHRTAVVSHGLSVLGKYIPGKVWVILGRASYVSREKHRLKDISYVSLKEQLIYLLLGLLISSGPALFYFKNKILGISSVVFILILIIIVFNRKAHAFMETVLKRIALKDFLLPELKVNLAFKLSAIVIIYWFIWVFGFYALLLSYFSEPSFICALAFPISVCYGILAILMPGGIGVREGIMVAFLISSGMNAQDSITFSLISRFWFITGELFIFLAGVFLKGGLTSFRIKQEDAVLKN